MKSEYERTNYPSDLTDKQWEKIENFFPSGNKSKSHKRNLVEAVMYVIKTGCQWRAERTFSWFGGYRRLSKDFEYSVLS